MYALASEEVADSKLNTSRYPSTRLMRGRNRADRTRSRRTRADPGIGAQIPQEPLLREAGDLLQGPGSSKRWVAPGTTTSSFGQRSRARACRFNSRTSSSRPPTISRVGAMTSGKSSHARSGRPPRETTASTGSGRRAAATRAAAGAGAGAEVAQPEAVSVGVPAQPMTGGSETVRQQLDVEDVPTILGLVLLQQVDQQRRQAGVL